MLPATQVTAAAAGTALRSVHAPGRRLGGAPPTSRHHAATTDSTTASKRRGVGVTAACTSSHIRVENISTDANPAAVVVAVAATGGGPPGGGRTSRVCPLPDSPLSTK